jgi:transposase
MSATSRRYSPEVKERAVRLVREHRQDYESEWAAIVSIAAKLGMTSESLRRWVRDVQVDAGEKPGVTTDERRRVRELEREVRELRRANEILKSASVFFATELDGRTRT